MATSITHQVHDQEFTLKRQGHSAELAYSYPSPGIIDFTHTYVEEALRGQGVGEQLAEAGLAYARQQQLRVRASCPFVQAYLQRHPQHADLLELRT
ncbi:GNAT family N-acetyltransferase [Hymenobacter metallilatus]|nr:GNAT family N-acetyltransferase [Hymenobacter metallilatus]